MRGIALCHEWKENSAAFLDWGFANGWMHGLQIDRIDNDGNYSPDNCRFISPRKNCLNRRLIRSDNVSNYQGVSYYSQTQKWLSRIGIKGKRMHLGYYATKKLAVLARNDYIISNDLQHEYAIQKWAG
jgi:hypothetical protein